MNTSSLRAARRLAASVTTAIALSAGLASVAMASSPAFDARLSSVIQHVKAEPGYRKIPIDTTADRTWFAERSEALYKKQITKEQYVADGVSRFPGYDASFGELADLLTAP